ncbi:uncharacterized protein LOC123320987 [Coccinella septempunctata]|uniref:uncharacterized protein LOC123320987 n=1 Tax=Coccinella septempunctata TaxID=41139 RepID=UPI001D09770E|nr:uncharacterized protein LOC123320987 [Coccinella septempunctata]
MAPLPEMRLEPKLPFQVTGVDYAGPMSIKSKSGRGFQMSKAYVCLFVCAITKAIHIELVTDSTKESFLLALKRFVSRRGRPSVICSDNGTNFKAASQDLIELGKFISNNKDELEEFFNRNEFNWKFIPPYSPHFGGLWEAGVKRMKYHLRSVTRNLILTFEQLDTLLIEIEAILNSRPLSPLSDSSHDLLPLKPQHFLIGRSSAYFQEPDLSHLSVNRMSLFQHLTQVKQHIWRRWSKEYVSELQQRTKWKSNHEALKVNSLVLLKEDNTPVMQWKLGRIEAIHTGADGVPRVASIRTQNGTVKRTFPRICPLPFDRDESH